MFNDNFCTAFVLSTAVSTSVPGEILASRDDYLLFLCCEFELK